VQLVIDLDLDLFVHPTILGGRDCAEHALSEEHQASPMATIECFLHHQLKLQPSPPTPGLLFDYHVQSYEEWRKLIISGRLKIPFEVIHVDAHDDLLSGFEVTYLLEEWIKEPDKIKKRPERLTSANYLGFAVVNGWVGSLTWVHRPESQGVGQRWLFKDFTAESGLLQPKEFVPGGIARSSEEGRIRAPAGIFESRGEIPFVEFDFPYYEIERKADFLFVARSPSYTPKELDDHLDLVRVILCPLTT
jgi:hypothetical protein